MLKIKKNFYAMMSALVLLPFLVQDASAEVDIKSIGLPEKNPGAGGTDNIAQVIGKIVIWLLGFVGGLSVLMIILAGIMYITSGGDEGRVEKAKQWLIYAIVGLIIALLGWVIVNTIVKAL